jgi:hypothetical protein
MTNTQDRSDGLPLEGNTSVTSGKPQGSQQDMHPNHSHEMGLGNNTPSRNTKTRNETETKSRIKTDENAPVTSSTSQQGCKHPVKTSEHHENTRSQHNQGRHNKGTPKGHRDKPTQSRHRSNQIPRNLVAFIVNKTISSSTARPSRRKRNFKTFGNCYSKIKKGSTTPVLFFFCIADMDSSPLSSHNSQERALNTCLNLLQMTPTPSPPT